MLNSHLETRSNRIFEKPTSGPTEAVAQSFLVLNQRKTALSLESCGTEFEVGVLPYAVCEAGMWRRKWVQSDV